MKDLIVKNLKAQSFTTDDFNLEAVKKGKEYNLTIYNLHTYNNTNGLSNLRRLANVQRVSPLMAHPMQFKVVCF
jgi:hypothetical protein